MNVPGVLAGADPILEKILRFQDRVMDGHCPGLRGKDLQAYVTAGIGSDHETTGPSEGLEKLESGMMIMIREGTSAKNMEPLLPLVTPATSRRFCLVTDDLHAEDIQERGHLDFVVSKATGLGLDPVTAIQMVTLNPAEFFGLTDRGAIGPGFRADLVVLDDLEDMRVSAVYKDGCRVVDQGEMVGNHGTRKGPSMAFTQTVHIPVLDPAHLRIPHAQGRARVIEVIPGQIITRAVEFEPPQSEGVVVPDLEADVLKLTVVERHTGGGNVGLGLVKGFGLTQGALASSVAHDSHNVIAVGVTDGEMLRAIEEIRRMGGGLVAVRGEAILARVKLEIAGLMSRQPLEEVVRELKALKEGAAALGCRLEEPFMALSFLALPVIPELKLTDMGLVDVAAFRIVPLFLEHQEVT
jgi:adenine deaminase